MKNNFFYLYDMIRYNTHHVRLIVLITIIVCSFSSQVRAGYWAEAGGSGVRQARYEPFMQKAGFTPFSTIVLGGGNPNLIDKNGPVYSGISDSGVKVDFSLYAFNNTTAIIGLSGSGALTNLESSTGQCYFIPSFYSGAIGDTAEIIRSHKSSEPNSVVGVYYAPEQSVVINKNCNEITGNDPELNQLVISFNPANYYIPYGTPNGCGPSTCNGKDYNNFVMPGYNDMFVYNLRRADSVVSSVYNIFICPTNIIDNNCVRTNGVGNGGEAGGGGEIITPISCNLSGNNDGLDFGTVSSDDYIGKNANYQLNVSCSGDADMKFSIVQSTDIKLGPFKVKVKINDDDTPILNIGKNVVMLNIDGILESASEEIKAGIYENSIIILAEQQ